MTLVIVSFTGYGLSGRGCSTAEFAVDMDVGVGKRIVKTSREYTWICSHGNSNLDACIPYDGTIGYVIQQESHNLVVAAALYAPAEYDNRGGPPADVKITLPPQSVAGNVPGLVVLTTALATGFEGRFIKDGKQRRNGDFYSSCLEIVQENMDLLESLSIYDISNDKGHRLNADIRAPSRYPVIHALFGRSEVRTQEYRKALERTAISMFEDFLSGHSEQPVVLLSDHNAQQLPHEAKIISIKVSPEARVQEQSQKTDTDKVKPATLPPAPCSSPTEMRVSVGESRDQENEASDAVDAHGKSMLFHINELQITLRSRGPNAEKARATLRKMGKTISGILDTNHG